MKTKNKTALAIAALQLGAQIASSAHVYNKRRESELQAQPATAASRAAHHAAGQIRKRAGLARGQAVDHAGAAAAHASKVAHAAQQLPGRALDQMPSRRRARARRRHELEIAASLGILALVGAIVALLMRRTPEPLGRQIEQREADAAPPVPGRIAQVAHDAADAVSDHAEAIKSGAVQTAEAIASGSSLAKASATNAAKVAIDEHVTQPAKAKAIHYGALGVLGLAAIVIVSVIIGSLAALGIYDGLFGLYGTNGLSM